ncbi:MAG: anti-sigma factor domain-containing protein [Actinobacteria bacterium]|nr:anti-sigma factor domain-containing protein [Actinomycetota bacterium]
MKAVVMEIYKDYCIVMTKDGQFLRNKISVGRFEIGDEIVIERHYSYEPKVSLVARFAVAAAVMVVLALGAVLGVRYISQYHAARGTAMVAEEAATEKAIVEEALPVEEGAEEPALAMEAGQEETIIYKSERVHYLEEEGMIEEYIEEIKIMFSYKVTDGTSLWVGLKNSSSTDSFNGTFKLVMLLSDGSVARTKTISPGGIEPGKIYEESFPLEAGETDFRLEVTESIN